VAALVISTTDLFSISSGEKTENWMPTIVSMSDDCWLNPDGICLWLRFLGLRW
jgi:hypothetical protein